jgi:hypothetical protein
MLLKNFMLLGFHSDENEAFRGRAHKKSTVNRAKKGASVAMKSKKRRVQVNDSRDSEGASSDEETVSKTPSKRKQPVKKRKPKASKISDQESDAVVSDELPHKQLRSKTRQSSENGKNDEKGTRIWVYWDGEQKWFRGTLTGEKDSQGRHGVCALAVVFAHLTLHFKDSSQIFFACNALHSSHYCALACDMWDVCQVLYDDGEDVFEDLTNANIQWSAPSGWDSGNSAG